MTLLCFRGAWLLISLGFHSPGNSLFHVSEVHGFATSSGFHSPVSVLSLFQRCTVCWFPHGFISTEYTFPCVRGTRFSNFFRVSFTCEFTFHLSEVHGFVLSSGFHSPVNSVSPVSEVHSLVVSLGFHSPVSSLSCVSEVHRTGLLRVSSLVSTLSHVSEVHILVISLGFIHL